MPETKLDQQTVETSQQESLRSPSDLRVQAAKLVGQREEKQNRLKQLNARMEEIDAHLGIADKVSTALQSLSEELFEEVLGTLRDNLSVALQDVLDQPIKFAANADFKRGAAVVEFSIDREGNQEDIQKGQGGSVQNVLSVGLRIFALATLDEAEHRRFLVLDEQDCWLRPELVPKLVSIVDQAARKLDFQVLMISHHETGLFSRYADRIFKLEPCGNTVVVRQIDDAPLDSDIEY